MTDQNDDLRQLFDEATSDIRPQGSYDEIRSRTRKVDPVARHWFLPGMAAAAVMALVIGGAFYVTRGDSDGPGPATTPQLVGAKVFYLGDGAHGPRLFTETHDVESVDGSAAVAAANAALTGKPLDADYRTMWPVAADVTAVRTNTATDGVTAVTFADAAVATRPSGMSKAEAQASVDALVRTVQAASGATGGVDFYVGDQLAPQVLGVDTSAPQTGGSDDVLASVQILSPADNSTVPTGDLTVTGVASAFEANLNWELLVGGDAVVDSGVATAAECCTLSPYSFTIKNLQPGSYTLVVHDTDESGEGLPLNRDTKEIVVQ